MKGLFAILAVIVLGLSIAGCGGAEETESTTPTEESATTTEPDYGTATEPEPIADPVPVEDEGIEGEGTEGEGTEGEGGDDVM